MTRRVVALLTAGIAAATLSACGSSGSSGSSGTVTTTRAKAAAKTVPPEPAGPEPSESAKMICSHEAQRDIAASLGVDPVQVTAPTWVDHVYECKYVFSGATLTLSVKELDNAAQTTAYFDSLARQLGRQPGRLELGEGAFQTSNGSVVVRKDWKVLLVDASEMPAQFGQPPLSPGDTALSAALTVLSCWTGA